MKFIEVRPENCRCPILKPNKCICKKRAFGVSTKKNVSLGMIEWNKKWKCYTFNSWEETQYSEDCLVEIVDFLKVLK